MRLLILSALCALIFAGCAARGGGEPVDAAAPDGLAQVAPRDMPVESFVLVDVEDANSRTGAAAEAGEQWPFDALAVAQRFTGPDASRYLSIEKTDEMTESPNATTITLVSGGYLDDSVWGVWNQLLLSRGADGVWHIDEARRAWRCYRGHQTDSFGEQWCL